MRAFALALLLFACTPSAGPAPAPAPPTAVASGSPSETSTPAPAASDAGAPLASDAGASLDVQAEFAWARSRFAKELAKIDTRRHGDELFQWVTPGAELQVWFSGEKRRCQKAVLRRENPNRDLDLTVYTSDQFVKGARVRSFENGSAGHLLWLGGEGGSERQQPDGSFQSEGMWGKSDQPALGVLSEVTPDVARYDGTNVRIDASCDGPMQNVACADGGAVACDTCQNLKLDITPTPVGMGVGTIGRVVRLGCASCPDSKNADLDRANRLFADLEAWTTVRAKGAPITAIYRSLQACRGDKGKP